MILNMKGRVGCAGQRESLANPAFVWQEVRREKKNKKIRRGRAGNTRSKNTGGILQARVQFSAACPFDVSLSSPCGSRTATTKKISSRVFYFVFCFFLFRPGGRINEKSSLPGSDNTTLSPADWLEK